MLIERISCQVWNMLLLFDFFFHSFWNNCPVVSCSQSPMSLIKACALADGLQSDCDWIADIYSENRKLSLQRKQFYIHKNRIHLNFQTTDYDRYHLQSPAGVTYPKGENSHRIWRADLYLLQQKLFLLLLQLGYTFILKYLSVMPSADYLHICLPSLRSGFFYL